MAQSIFDLQAALCHAMANASRLRIVHLLRDGPQCVGQIAQATHLPNSQVSQHLAILRAHSLVTAQRRGSEIVYRLANPKIAHVCDSMREVLAEQAAASAAIAQMLQDGELSKAAKK
jgi:ArsR family transcriptional regulator